MERRNRNDERFKEFLAESEEILNTMGRDLVRLGKGVKAGVIDPSVLNSIFRSAHTLKGMSGVFDFHEMSTLSHSLEDTLDLLRMGRIALNDEVLSSVLDAHELLTKIISARGEGDFAQELEAAQRRLGRGYQPKKQAPREHIDKEILSLLTEYEEHRLRESLREGRNILIVTVNFPITSFDKGYLALTEALKSEAEVIATLPSGRSTSDTLYFDILTGTKRDKSFVLDVIKGITEGEIRVLSEPSRAVQEAREEQKEQKAVHRVEPMPPLEVLKVEGEKAEQAETLRKFSDTVRVNISKLDNIMNIISELGILKSNMAALSIGMKNVREFSAYGIELSRAEKYLEKKLSELRDSVLDVRMVPISQLFNRFETFIVKLSRDCGKEIRMFTGGGDTELDKLIIEELADPLMHIIRNVADHAIEPPAAREAAGKPKAGTITLNAYQKINHVVVEVRDDGAGMDEEVIKRKAVEKGLITKDYAEGLSRQEALELIFLPGFSTRDSVTETSGRGVGMDVVKENVTKLSGIIDIETVKGKGTSFMLTIPITLAIIQTLIVEDAGVRYAVPLNSVIEIVELKQPFMEEVSTQDYIVINDRNTPAVRLCAFFGREGAPVRDVHYGIVAGLAEHRVCVMVDRLIEELDVVIRPLPPMLKVAGIAGATDMGEKGTVLVLDITGILEELMKEKKTFVSVRIA